MAEGQDAPQREDDPRDTRIKQQDREISRLRGDLAQVNRDRDRWKRHSELLQQQLDTARRAGFRQAAPFAKVRPQGRGGRPGRRAGARYGRQACRRRPAQVDETHAAPVPAACPDCGGAIEVTRVASQCQEEIPEVRPVVRRFDIEVRHFWTVSAARAGPPRAADLGCAGRGRCATGPRSRGAGRRVAYVYMHLHQDLPARIRAIAPRDPDRLNFVRPRLYEGVVHAKRPLSLANATLGVLTSASLAISCNGPRLRRGPACVDQSIL